MTEKIVKACKITGDEPINAIIEVAAYNTTEQKGLTIRQHFAAMAEEDFGKYELETQEAIVGRKIPTKSTMNYRIEIAKWFIDGEAMLKVMKADALISALNK